jgi:hypothetical protein
MPENAREYLSRREMKYRRVMRGIAAEVLC